jgi:hypothetical protein
MSCRTCLQLPAHVHQAETNKRKAYTVDSSQGHVREKLREDFQNQTIRLLKQLLEALRKQRGRRSNVTCQCFFVANAFIRRCVGAWCCDEVERVCASEEVKRCEARSLLQSVVEEDFVLLQSHHD